MDNDKQKMKDMRDRLVKITADLSLNTDVPPEDRIGLLIAGLQSNPNPEMFETAVQTIEQMEDGPGKLNASMDVMSELDLQLGDIKFSDEPDHQPLAEQKQPDHNQEHHEG